MNVPSLEKVIERAKEIWSFNPPLETVLVTQKFGDNDLAIYKELGLKGHNGWDLRAGRGTDVLACFDGEVNQATGDGGYGINIFLQTEPFLVENRKVRLQAVYGHLKEFSTENGIQVHSGDVIAKSDNTGLSTGDHLHFGIRPFYFIEEAVVSDVSNGYFGYVDPALFYEKELLKSPAWRRYGQQENKGRERDWSQRNMLYFIRKTLRLPSTEEYRAFVYGYWDIEAIREPTMYRFWQFVTKPEYEKRVREFKNRERKSVI